MTQQPQETSDSLSDQSHYGEFEEEKYVNGHHYLYAWSKIF